MSSPHSADRARLRKIGVLVTNGADAEVLAALRAAAEQSITEIVAPSVGGVDSSDGTRVPAGTDDGFISLDEHPAAEFIGMCRRLRRWHRQLAPSM